MGYLVIQNLTKRFGAVTALNDVSLEIDKGTIHAIVGENGAGKSTLIGVISGQLHPDRGKVFLEGKELPAGNPRLALALGIATAYQDDRLCPDLDIAQNIYLPQLYSQSVNLDHQSIYKSASNLLEELGIDISPTAPVFKLSESTKQLIGIARALALNPKVLLLDEPTSRLGVDEVNRLFTVLKARNENGLTVVLISHRMNEVFELARTISVLRDGRLIDTVDAASTSVDAVVAMMVGREIEVLTAKGQTDGDTGKDQHVVLEAENIATADGTVNGVSVKLHAGEVLGILGVQGNGQRELLRSVFGLLPLRHGKIKLGSSNLGSISPGKALAKGIIYISSDKATEGIFKGRPVRENITIGNLSKFSLLGVMRQIKEAIVAHRLVAEFAVRLRSIEQPIESLSGGTQQKVILARWLERQPKVLLLDEPTQGIDVATKAEIYRYVRSLAKNGVAVALLTSDAVEAELLSDRALVLSRGSVVTELQGDQINEASIVSAAVASDITKKTGTTNHREVVIKGNGSMRFSKFWDTWASTIGVFLLNLVLGGVTQAFNSAFLSQYNLVTLAAACAPLIFVTLGQSVVLLVGGIDLSVGPLMSTVTVAASYLFASHSPDYIAGIPAILGLGMVAGLINGLIIQYLGISDLIVTLGSYSVFTGVALIIRSAPGGVLASSYMDYLGGTGSIPYGFIFALIIGAIMVFVQLRTRIGIIHKATGSSPKGAVASGININLIRILSYVISGLLGSMAGLLLAGLIGSGDPTSGGPYTLESISAAVVGGISLFGGKGNLAGAFIGAILITALNNFLGLLGVSQYWQPIWTGLLIVLAVAFYSLRERQLPPWLKALSRGNIVRSVLQKET